MLKVVLFDFNGVIINDEPIHRQLIDEILLAENLRPASYQEHQEFCLGRSDRVCLRALLAHRGRPVSEEYLTKLIEKKAIAYRQKLAELDTLPIYDGLKRLLAQIQLKGWPLGLVTGAVKSETILVLKKAELFDYFQVIVAGDEINTSKPQPDGYLLAIERFNQLNPELQLEPKHCLAIEDSLAGLQAAKNAGIKVIGIAHTYPYHFMQRYGNWAVDKFSEIDLDRIEILYSRKTESILK
ncbi:MAG: HAD family phosphatase [Snowella sp.]|nr:HAD family phosphatase [Snowella sp.]